MSVDKISQFPLISSQKNDQYCSFLLGFYKKNYILETKCKRLTQQNNKKSHNNIFIGKHILGSSQNRKKDNKNTKHNPPSNTHNTPFLI